MFYTNWRRFVLFVVLFALLPEFSSLASDTHVPIKEGAIPLMPKEFWWGMTREEAEANTRIRELKTDTAPIKAYGMEKFEAFNTEFRLIADFADGGFCIQYAKRGNGLCRIGLAHEGRCPIDLYDRVKEYFLKNMSIVSDMDERSNREIIRRFDVNDEPKKSTVGVILYCDQKKDKSVFGISIELKDSNR